MEEFQISNTVKVARVHKDLTQQQLADAIGVTRQTIGLIEAGKFNPTIKLCLLLARALDRSLDELFWMEDSHDETI